MFKLLCFIIEIVKDDVDKFMEKSENSNVEDVLKKLDEQHSKYKFFEYNLITKRKRYCIVYFSSVNVIWKLSVFIFNVFNTYYSFRFYIIVTTFVN